jgi:hypothetical protein
VLADEPLAIDEHQARRTAHVVALHGVRYRASGVRAVEPDRKFQAILVYEGLEHRQAVGLMMFERGVQPHHRHVTRLESLVNPPRLRNGGGDRMGAQNLKCNESHYTSA